MSTAIPVYSPDIYSRDAILDPYPHYERLRALAPRALEDAGDGAGLFAWEESTVVALGLRRSVPKLRAIARDLTRLAT
jgi:hypothetical protein